ncbi:MAG: sensor histidine kinase [Christensenellaceae bacterium]|nr:sensor histidine kinase [Christensenellaceae bacterium]
MSEKRVSWFQNLSISARLAVLFAVVSIIPVLVIGLLSLRISSQSTLERGVQDRLNRLEFVDYRMVELIRRKHRDVLLVAFNPYVRAYFDEHTRLGSANLIEDQTKRQLISLYNKQESTSAMLAGNGGTALVYGAVQSSAVNKVDISGKLPLRASDFKLFDRWAAPTFENGEPVVPYERLVLAESDNRPVARLILNVKESVFGALYRDYEVAAGTEFFIASGQGILSCTDKQLYGQTIADALGFSPDRCEGESGYFPLGGSIITYRHNRARGLLFLERAPIERFTAGFWPIVQLTAAVSLLCVAVCAALGAAMSRSFTKPRYRLIERVSSFDAAAPGTREQTRNEFAILSDKYARILGRLETLIGEYYEEQQKKKEAQIRALEFQINPHFLYNTLSTIVWLIDAGENRTAIRVTKDLSAFFRLSISKGREFIPLKDELHHVELYIDIQKARYADCIFVEYEVEEEALPLYTPKLILQPLVENSVIHAMQTRADKTCHIRITARRDGDDVLLEVRDDGDTITAKTIDSMNRFLYDRDQSEAAVDYGIGISNVHDRIRMSFGDGYGLYYRREGGETVAALRIVAMEGNRNV